MKAVIAKYLITQTHTRTHKKRTNTKYTPLGFADGFRNNIVVDAGTVDVMTHVTRSLVGSVVLMVYTVVSTVVSSVISIANGNPIILGG